MENLIQEGSRPKKNRIAGKRTIVVIPSNTLEKIKIKESLLQRIGLIADELGVKLYIVGGYVRDYYLNRPRTDFDFTVVGDSISFAETIARKFLAKAVVYERFRTAMVPIEGFKCEFVGTRTEECNPKSRKPKVKEGTLEDDLRRRDFSINAIAASMNKDTFGVVIDKYNGKADIESQLIRTPLDPLVTFNDDPLRMLRAARFSAQLGFRLDNKINHAISKMTDRISIISQERITDELLKILASPKPSTGFEILYQTGLLAQIFPELNALSGVEIVKDEGRKFAHKDILSHSLKVLDNIAQVSDNIWLRFAALVHDIAKPITKKFSKETGWSFHGHEELGARFMETLFRRMTLPLEHLDYVTTLVRLHQRPMVLVEEGVTDSAVRRLAFQAGAALEDLFILCRADITTNNPKLSSKYLNNYDLVAKKVIEVQEKDKLREFQSPVRGEEIMEICGLKPSRMVGIIKSAIETAILDGLIPNEYEQAKKFFLEHKDIWLKEVKDDNIEE